MPPLANPASSRSRNNCFASNTDRDYLGNYVMPGGRFEKLDTSGHGFCSRSISPIDGCPERGEDPAFYRFHQVFAGQQGDLSVPP